MTDAGVGEVERASMLDVAADARAVSTSNELGGAPVSPDANAPEAAVGGATPSR
ncbi:MAG: hypothetical protein MUF34_23560 [Polyangiaceae bacterium]|nr:hypothetical protein [Polyangiaceae bacterium]